VSAQVIVPGGWFVNVALPATEFSAIKHETTHAMGKNIFIPRSQQKDSEISK
jgi:hypothetical protein